MGELRSTIAAIKTHSAYTDAIGADLGVVGSPGSFDPNTYKAELTSVEQTGPNQMTIKFGKAKDRGRAQARDGEIESPIEQFLRERLA